MVVLAECLSVCLGHSVVSPRKRLIMQAVCSPGSRPGSTTPRRRATETATLYFHDAPCAFWPATELPNAALPVARETPDPGVSSKPLEVAPDPSQRLPPGVVLKSVPPGVVL